MGCNHDLESEARACLVRRREARQEAPEAYLSSAPRFLFVLHLFKDYPVPIAFHIL